MMTNLYRQNDRRRGTKRLVAATALAIFLLGADAFSGGAIRGLIRDSAAQVSYGALRSWGAITHLGIFESRATLARENADLRNQVQSLTLKAAAFDVLQEDDLQLRAMTRLATEYPKGVTAPIVSSFFAAPYGSFTIGAGNEVRIQRKDLVLMTTDDTGSSAFAVGTISDVSAHTALVSTFFAPRNQLPVRVANTEQTLIGDGVNTAHILVPRGITVHEGDIVTSVEHEGHPVGIVVHIEADPADAYSRVFVSLPVSPAARQYVYVETN